MTSGRPEQAKLVGIISVLLLVVAVLVVFVSGWWNRDDAARPQTAQDAGAGGTVERVVVISVDGLASYAVTPDAMPELTTLLDEGAGTMNARTIERTITLPNHTSMVTGRPMLEALGGHGVDWNEDRADTAVRDDVESVFTVLDDAGLDTAVFAGKDKFILWDRSWPIGHFVIEHSLDDLTDDAVEDLHAENRALTFIHVANPDAAGHESGWASQEYDAAVIRADAVIGRVIDAIGDTPTAVIVTADHGGIRGTQGHYDIANPESYTIPFVVWGSGIAQGDLYGLNTNYREPGTEPPSYAGPPLVRNADVANLTTDLLGLPPVPGSTINAAQDLDVTPGSRESQ